MSGSDARPGKIRVWGLTGGIASGKSTAARLFEKLGVPVIDADQLARELSAPGGAAHADIVKRFGTDDRAKLREIIFADPKARKDLEAILHPLIRTESDKRIRFLAEAHPGEPASFFVIYEAALLVETGRWRDLEGLIVVDAPRSLRRMRLMERDEIDGELADKILAAQSPDAERRAAASIVLDNSSSQDVLRKKVRHLTERLRGLGGV